MKQACDGFIDYERRAALRLGAGVALSALGLSKCFSQLGLQSDARPTEAPVLVVLFLRGGMDGLHAVPPIADDAYYRARPTLAIAAPQSGKAAVADRALRLNDQFGLHPTMAAMLPLFESGELEIIHAVGSQDRTHSHFEAMSAMERGMAANSDAAQDGWLSRYIRARELKPTSPLRAVALTQTLPASLSGSNSVALEDLSQFRLSEQFRLEALSALYAQGDDPLAAAGRETLSALRKLNRFDPKQYQPDHGAHYEANELAQAFRQAAFLIKANVGLEIACIDELGWDSHVAQGNSTGITAGQLGKVANAVATFNQDMGKEMSRVRVVVMTEFGRRVAENNGLGTDHGRGSAMFVLGGGVKGGQVRCEWPGLEPHQLEDPGDLKVTTDYRTPLSEAITFLGGGETLKQVFPNF
ncbi:MAG: DUF1501 domain-containing protein [Armatimonadetes bacterium]|nr:DUF1501 domain-containing protein [Armatimonadota bacterium]